MTNMSYCAFENTVDDMNKCIEKLHYEYDYDLDLLKEKCSEKEYNAAVRFIQLCKEVSNNTYDGDNS
jgi:hypothetical protein